MAEVFGNEHDLSVITKNGGHLLDADFHDESGGRRRGRSGRTHTSGEAGAYTDHPLPPGAEYNSYIATVGEAVAAVAADKVRNGKRTKFVNEDIREASQDALEDISEGSEGAYVIRSSRSKPEGIEFRITTEVMTRSQAVLMAASEIADAAISRRRKRIGVGAAAAGVAVVGLFNFTNISEFASSHFGATATITDAGENTGGAAAGSENKGQFGPVVCSGQEEFSVKKSDETKASKNDSQVALVAMQRSVGDTAIGGFDYLTSLTSEEQKNFLAAVSTQLNGGADLNERGTHIAPTGCADQ